MTNEQKSSLRRETLIYLAKLPEELANNPGRAFPTLCISLGNFLKWASPLLDPPDWERIPPGVKPGEIKELGNAFRNLGLANWDQKSGHPTQSEQYFQIKEQLDEIQSYLVATRGKK